MTSPERTAALTRPIIGIENRTAQEDFDIMADRIRSHISTLPDAGGEPVVIVKDRFGTVLERLTEYPRGWRLVPVEPTEDMFTAGGCAATGVCECGGGFGVSSRKVYAAMLATAPHPPALPVGAEPSNLQKMQSASGGRGQPSSGSQPGADVGETAALANALVMTGCRDEEDLIDMANVGQGLLDRIDQLTKIEGPFKSWTPADDPCEIVFDLVNAMEEAGAREAELIAHLIATLPMAKGYAAANRVGRNAEKVAEAEAFLLDGATASTPPGAVRVSEEMVERAARKLREWTTDEEDEYLRDMATDVLTAALSAPMGDQGALVEAKVSGKDRMAQREKAIREANNPELCPRCGESGRHFVPPSMREPGFYICAQASTGGEA